MSNFNSNLPILRENMFSSIEQQFDRFFNEFWGSPVLDSVKANTNYPKMDVLVDGDFWKIRVAVPGVKKEDLSVEIDNNIVTIKGKMSEDYLDKTVGKYYIKELRKSAFMRQISLPEWLKTDPETSLHNGILELSWELPKPVKEEERIARKIEIKD